ncbi:MAG: ATP-binding protein [Actinomycetota bacterium]|nr:ATP-binding protein [Actinomycetota bacterium]
MSHELRTPLNSLLILSKLLADNPEANLTDKQVEFARTITSAGSDLLALISDILDLSKVEAGKMEVNPVRVALADVLAGLERTFRATAEQQGLAFRLELAEAAPEAVVTDDQRLHQVLRNLVSNAIKFTEAGEVRVRVDALADGGPHAVAIAVKDTGIGIPPDKLQLVFEAFQQADGTTSRRYGGTGLGLSISREIARLLGAEVVARAPRGRLPARADGLLRAELPRGGEARRPARPLARWNSLNGPSVARLCWASTAPSSSVGSNRARSPSMTSWCAAT